MAEVEYKGIKVGGSKLLLILPLLGTIIGGLWGGMEILQRYQSMEKKINSFVSPDMSGFDKRIDLVQQEVTMLQGELSMVLEEVQLVADVAKELKNDLKGDVRRIESIVEDVETRVKEDSRTNEKDLKETIKVIEEDMIKLEKKITDTIQKTLANPLAGMK
jgi:hypothetical protein|tara:strand:- start:901 stop:1383 length:483 start_codon:yes stop_codon:yes gene_type:complete